MTKRDREFQAAPEGGDYYDALKADERFHRQIVGVCGNPYIESIVAML